MKRNLKTVLALMLAVVMIGAILTSCSSGSGNAKGTSAANNASTSAKQSGSQAAEDSMKLEDYKDVYTITGYLPINNGAQGNDQMQHQWLLDNLKLDLQGTFSSGENIQTKLGTMVASNEMPDVIMCSIDFRPIMQQFVDAGMTLAIDEYLPKMPDYMGYVNDDILNYWRNQSDKKLYMLPGFTKPKEKINELLGDPMVFGIRSDVIEKAGKPIPKTPDELYEFCKAAKQNVGNEGVYKDFIPFGMMYFSGNTSGERMNDNIFAHAFGLPGGNVAIDDANQMIVEPFMQKPWQDAYKFLAKMYREKLVDPELITAKDQDKLEKGKQGKYGILFAGISDFGDNIEGAIKRLGITGTYENMELPKITGLEKTNWLYYNQLGGTIAIVNKNVKDPERLMKYINWQNTKIGNMITWWGAPDKENSWFYLENGEPLRNDAFYDALLKGEKNTDKVSPWTYWIAGPGVTATADINVVCKNSPGLRPFHKKAKEIGSAQVYNDVKLDKYLLSDKGPVYKQKWTDIDAVVSKYRAELIMRTKSDADFDAKIAQMQADLKKAGIDDVQKEDYKLYMEVNK
jgi:ABC-type sugar transport system, periplasmic component